jgi:hypothetical protein
MVGALSLATDLGMGQRLESALSISVLSTRLAERLGLPTGERVRAYYVALLRHIGCTAGSQDFAEIVGDELGCRRGAAPLDLTSRRELMPYMLR